MAEIVIIEGLGWLRRKMNKQNRIPGDENVRSARTNRRNSRPYLGR